MKKVIGQPQWEPIPESEVPFFVKRASHPGMLDKPVAEVRCKSNIYLYRVQYRKSGDKGDLERTYSRKIRVTARKRVKHVKEESNSL